MATVVTLTTAAPPAAHQPVLFAEVMDALKVRADGVYLDGTFGRGGHARGILQRLGPAGRLLLMDQDPEAIAVAREAFAPDVRVDIRHGSFANLADWAAVNGGLDGVLLDIGVSSPQLDVAGRGFSFSQDGPLDMRMNPHQGESAAQWLNRAEEHEIADVLWHYGEERASRKIARAVVARRGQTPITRTGELAELIAGVLPRGASKTHPATRSFQALRIHINQELEALARGLTAALAALRAGGRLAVISFHSLEDRMVKQFMLAQAKPPSGNRRLPEVTEFVPKLKLIGSACRATEAELALNPRARSAVLRVGEKLLFALAVLFPLVCVLGGGWPLSPHPSNGRGEQIAGIWT